MKLAEAVGFEPTVPFGTTVFKTASLSHSDTPPHETKCNATCALLHSSAEKDTTPHVQPCSQSGDTFDDCACAVHTAVIWRARNETCQISGIWTLGGPLWAHFLVHIANICRQKCPYRRYLACFRWRVHTANIWHVSAALSNASEMDKAVRWLCWDWPRVMFGAEVGAA